MDDFPDTLTQTIGVLRRRETEARILAPLVQALGDKFGHGPVREIVSKTIVDLAEEQGAALAAEYGRDVDAFLETLQFWTRDDAIEIEMLEQTETKLSYNVTRCRYAEMYRALGIEDLGAVLSCNRDFAMVGGFNPDATLTREKTILGGDACCTFRYDFSGLEKGD